MSNKLKKIMELDKEFLFQNYGRLPVCFVRGDSSYLFDQDNKKYIDLFSGIAVSNLGYNNKEIQKTIAHQAKNIIHSSNWFYNKEQIEAASLLSELSFPGKTLFVNSGAEANEAAIKLARRYGLHKSKKTYNIITFSNSFHGRTFGSMSATAQKKIHGGFGPIVDGFIYVPFNDIKSFKKAVHKHVTAVVIELIQGEGGINIADQSFVQEIYAICKKRDILFIVDEVQTGIGRTGKPFAFQHYNIIPDVITLAKGLGNGIPIGAMHTKNFLVEYLPGGAHGTTFGGNHLVCAVAATVLKELKKKSLFINIKKTSDYIFQNVRQVAQKTSIIKDVRGLGLHIGIDLHIPGMDIVREALARGLVINCTAEKVIRIMPPLTIPMNCVKDGLKIFETIIMEKDKQNI